ncbi:MAG: endo-1,4-beta-xylanase [Firmicutes bacterium]|nr:endo-1,4-beta-xylanase [Bacillota bacterium]
MDLSLPSLQKTFEKHFLFGNILSPYDWKNPETLEMFKHHFNALTPENAMKPVYVSPAPGEYDFEAVDKMVEWANENGIKMIGHTFVWHGQSAPWLNKNEDGSPKTRTEAKANMEAFIKAYGGRYSGRILSWDVINEAFRDGGEFSGNWRDHLRGMSENPRAVSPWYLAYANGADPEKGESGADYVFDAYYFARKYDPAATLYYNDYNEEFPTKREAIAQMVEEINQQWRNHPEYDGRLLIEGIGMQAHCNQKTNLAHVRESLERFAKTGAKISVTELDITFGSHEEPANPLTPEQSKRQAEMYTELFKMYLEYASHIERVTMWARHDGHSWRRWGSPVLFDKDLQPKEAFYAVVATAE